MKTGSITTIGAAVVIGCFAVFIGNAAGQQLTDRAVKPASFSRLASANAAQRVCFARQPSRVGDVVEQNIGLEMRLTMSVRQANKLSGQHRTTVKSNQRRVVTTTEADNRRTIAVKVSYPAATKQVADVEVAQGSGTNTNDVLTEPAPQPVQGKTYICRRVSGENGKLVITDEQGNRPPIKEYEIVAQQMQMVGRPNPLAQFLAGREIAIGEKIELPNDVASQIFNLGDRFGKVTRFTLTLEAVETHDRVTYGVFKAYVEAASNAATQMRLEVEGPMIIDVATCRAQKISLIGPIGMSETRGTYSTAYQLLGTGRLQMSIASAYRDATQ